jgi:hypothetical protein
MLQKKFSCHRRISAVSEKYFTIEKKFYCGKRISAIAENISLLMEDLLSTFELLVPQKIILLLQKNILSSR